MEENFQSKMTFNGGRPLIEEEIDKWYRIIYPRGRYAA